MLPPVAHLTSLMSQSAMVIMSIGWLICWVWHMRGVMRRCAVCRRFGVVMGWRVGCWGGGRCVGCGRGRMFWRNRVGGQIEGMIVGEELLCLLKYFLKSDGTMRKDSVIIVYATIFYLIFKFLPFFSLTLTCLQCL